MNINIARDLLGVPDDPKFSVEIDWDDAIFAESVCCHIGDAHAASVHIDWWSIDYDRDTDAPRWGGLDQAAFCWEHAREAITEISDESAWVDWEDGGKPFDVDDTEPMVKVVVHGAALRARIQVPA
ncbi:hypothetical protein [Nocardia sp. CC227C]|uniref:hypothetical protein n=1 Tax=Nocardia sp. CC227C TaxID=3044562 RepID=UPI00278C8BCF|nr:hypothetical protein [Nocardia sp. CC227C]